MALFAKALRPKAVAPVWAVRLAENCLASSSAPALVILPFSVLPTLASGNFLRCLDSVTNLRSGFLVCSTVWRLPYYFLLLVT
jgi:hypothetical protein